MKTFFSLPHAPGEVKDKICSTSFNFGLYPSNTDNLTDNRYSDTKRSNCSNTASS